MHCAWCVALCRLLCLCLCVCVCAACVYVRQLHNTQADIAAVLYATTPSRERLGFVGCAAQLIHILRIQRCYRANMRRRWRRAVRVWETARGRSDGSVDYTTERSASMDARFYGARRITTFALDHATSSTRMKGIPHVKMGPAQASTPLNGSCTLHLTVRTSLSNTRRRRVPTHTHTHTHTNRLTCC